jgi:hypothetical protein
MLVQSRVAIVECVLWPVNGRPATVPGEDGDNATQPVMRMGQTVPYTG